MQNPTCPSCGNSVPFTNWVNPSCPACEHTNAILEGVCRDCHKAFPELKGWIEFRCPACGARFNMEERKALGDLPQAEGGWLTPLPGKDGQP